MNRAVILAHHDRDGIVDPYVVRAASAYREIADQLIFVSASAPTLPPSLAGVVDRFVPRENTGYDFGSWRDGLRDLGDRSRFDEILFVNDSVYGPLFDLRPALESVRLQDADLAGMVLSAERQPHLQSWWFLMRRRLIGSAVCDEFWRSVSHQDSKEAFVDRYEIGLSQQVAAAGFRIAALVDGAHESPPSWLETARNVSPLSWTMFREHRRQLRRRGPPYNPSDLHWRRLWQAGVPYVKVSLFRRNQYAIDTRRVLAALGRLAPEWESLIAAHLARVSGSGR